jgi:transposase-like protein
VEKDFTPSRDNIIQLNEAAIRNHLGQIVRSTVEQTLNDMLDAEANQLCNAEKYQRNEARPDTRAGHYQRKLQTQAGEVTLNVPKLRRQTFETAIIVKGDRFIFSSSADAPGRAVRSVFPAFRRWHR